MGKIFEERTCIVCGKKWTVEVKPRNKGVAKRCMCDDCIKRMTPAEKQKYYRLHEGKAILEERECLNCGHKWLVDVKINKVGELSKMRYFCNDCNKLLTNWQKKSLMLEKVEGYKEKYLQEKRKSRIRNAQHYLWKRAKDRAEKQELAFNIKESDVIIPEICPILEVPFEWGTKGEYEYSPSLDKIDPTKGYVKGNVWVISKKANSMKNSASPQELDVFCKNVLKYKLTQQK